MRNKILLTIAISFFTLTSAFSQTVNGIPISEIDVDYIEIVIYRKVFNVRVNLYIDYGQDSKKASKNRQVLDEKGYLMTFESRINAINFMSKNGYEVVDIYPYTISDEKYYYYLLKKRK